jgi:hypothetical protein
MKDHVDDRDDVEGSRDDRTEIIIMMKYFFFCNFDEVFFFKKRNRYYLQIRLQQLFTL